jgi:tyrosinase
MVRSSLSFAAFAVSALLSTVTAAPTSVRRNGCTDANIEVRKDWGEMSGDERIAYTDAVNCIMKQPSNLDPTLYPGATNKFEDYAAIHIARSLNIHVSGFFLTWHRLYLQLWYHDLQETCGYTGAMPYWNWPATAGNLQTSSVFDGSPTSMSGDGLANNTGPIGLGPNFTIPHGTGGGCVTTGPFANYQTTFAPIDIGVALSGGPLPPNAFNYNPSCLTRDLNSFVANTWTTQAEVDAAVALPDIASFQASLNGNVTADNLGLHLGAHFTVGGIASNLFTSPQDPIWYLLHAYMDKVYVDWQTANPGAAFGVSGTETFSNVPPSAPVTADTYQPDWGYFYPSVTVGDLLDTKAGPFCYKYV